MWKKVRSFLRSFNGAEAAPSEKTGYLVEAARILEAFMASEQRLAFPSDHQTPKVTVILVLYNKASLTLGCLRSLQEATSAQIELIIVDNASSDETSNLLNRIDGAVVVRNSTNEGFLSGCNAAARIARGEYLLFLNNDTIVASNAISEAVKTHESDAKVGAVAARIIHLDGKLQEAGSIVWKDGECLGYGRGDDPTFGAFMYQREVDYGSGAFLLTPRALFLELGGFDVDFKPAYYEDTDYCTRLRKHGLKIIYEPFSVIHHYEFGSATPGFSPFDLMTKHQKLFRAKHRAYLDSHQLDRRYNNVLKARDSRRNRRHILFIDDRVPFPHLGAGYPRAKEILKELNAGDSQVTFYPIVVFNDSWESIYADFPKNIEVISGLGARGLSEFLASRSGFYDLILVSRPGNMSVFRKTFLRHPEYFRNTRIIYDAEAVFSNRERIYYDEVAPPVGFGHRIRRAIGHASINAKFRREMDLAKGAALVLAVSENEKLQFKKWTRTNVMVLGHSIEPVAPSGVAHGFSERRDFLFVGAVHGHPSPNSDSLIWFVTKVFPRIQKRLGNEVHFRIVGINNSPEVAELASNSIKLLGRVNKLDDVFSQARVFVAPTRFAAGIPHKVHEAASRGIPSVISDLLREQLGWTHGIEALSASVRNADLFADCCVRLYQDETLWKSVRAAALHSVRTECAPERFRQTLREALGP